MFIVKSIKNLIVFVMNYTITTNKENNKKQRKQ